MNRLAFAPVALIAAATSAQAVLVPFTETFNTDAANWATDSVGTTATHVASGGPDNSGYITTTTNTANGVDFGTGPILTVFRAHDEFNSSSDNFVGDWLANGVTEFSFNIRHDAPEGVGFFVRFASPANFPGALAVNFFPTPVNQWSTITVAIDPTNPQFVSFEGSDFNTVFSNVGHVQIGYTVPNNLVGTETLINVDLDNASIVPAPATAAFGLAGGIVAFRRRR